MRIDIDRSRGFHGFGDGLETDPAPGEAAHGPAEQTHVENVLHTGRVQHRHHRRHELQFRTVRQGRAAAGMVVGGQRQHAAQWRGAGGIAVLEHVTAAVHARALAVPHGKHAVVVGAFKQISLLRAPDHGRAQVLVQAGREHDVGIGQMLFGFPQFQIEAAQRRAAVAGDEAGAVDPGGAVAHLLHQRQAHQRLHAGQVNATLLAAVFVVEGIVPVDAGRERGGRRHGRAGE